MLISFAYFAAVVGDSAISLVLLILSTISFLFGLLVLYTWNTWKTKDVSKWKILYGVITYILLVLYSSFCFGLFFFFYSLHVTSGLFIDATKISSLIEYIYFSFTLFYSSTFDNVIPFGFSKIIVVLELIFTSIVHIFILGVVISKISRDL